MNIKHQIGKKCLKELCKNLIKYRSEPGIILFECNYQDLIYNGSDRIPNDCRMCCYAGLLWGNTVFECIRDRVSGVAVLK